MKLLSGPIVGAVTRNKAKVWIFWNRDQEDEALPVCHVFKDQTCTEKDSESTFRTISSSVHEADGIKGIVGLAEISFPPQGERFYYKIIFPSIQGCEGDQTYTIRSFPEAGADIDTLSFGLISCHRPLFKPKHDENKVAPMWQHLGQKMREHDCRFLVQAGDQVYTDQEQYNAWEKALDQDSTEEGLWHYRKVYHKSWNYREVQKVLREFPQYMIWDDHEITNGWGSSKEHFEGKCPQAFEIARQAYVEFQHSHNPDSLREGKLYFAFNYGPVAFLFMDLRGHRDIRAYDPDVPGKGYPLAGEKQWEDIKAWFESEVVQKSKMMFVVTSVPVAHLNRRLVDFGFIKNDIRDQWSTSRNKGERRILLNLLYRWSGEERRPVFILGGDVHVGTVAEIKEVDTGKKIHQITSSPITNKPAYLLDLLLALISNKFDFHLEENKKRPVHGEITKRCRRRNFAIIEVKFTEQKPQVILYIYKYKVRRKKLKVDRIEYRF